MKSILIVTEQFKIGGLETQIRGEAEKFIELGISVHLATGSAFDETLLPAHLSSVTNDLPLEPTATTEAFLRTISCLRRIIRENSIEAVHIHPFASIIPAAMAAELESIPYALTLHGPASLHSYGAIYDFLVKDVILPAASLIVAVSPEVRKLVTTHAADEAVSTIPNSVSFLESDYEALNTTCLDPRWLAVSRLDEYKIPGLLDFCIKARTAGIPGVLIAGDGAAKVDFLAQLTAFNLESYVTLLGVSSDVQSLIRQTSGVAGMGRVVLEGISHKKPVVLVGYDGVKGVVDKPLLERAAVENFSGRGLSTIDANELANQLERNISKTSIELTHAFAKAFFNEKDTWNKFLKHMASVPRPVSSTLTGLYGSLSGNPIIGTTPFIYSIELLERLSTVICSRNYYDERLAAALSMCWQRIHATNLRDAITVRDGEVTKLRKSTTERDETIANLEHAATARDATISQLNHAISALNIRSTNLSQEVTERNATIASLEHVVAVGHATTDELNHSIGELNAKITNLNQMLAAQERDVADLNDAVMQRDAKIGELNNLLVIHHTKISEIAASTSWRITTPIRSIKRASLMLTNAKDRYSLMKSIYWRLPERVRTLLNSPRHRLVAHRLKKNLNTVQKTISDDVEYSFIENSWIRRCNEVDRIAVIPCGFEFDDLVNQRPINAAKHYSAKGYLVLFIAWQWFPQEPLSKGTAEVYPNVIQVPLYEFLNYGTTLQLEAKDCQFIATMPAPHFRDSINTWRSKGGIVVYDIMDDWEEFYKAGQAPWYEKQVEESLVVAADYVSAVSPGLRRKFSHMRSDIAVIGNGYTPSTLGASYRGIAGKTSDDRIVIGYFGHLTDAWFDWELILSLAETHTAYTFEIIGYGEPIWIHEKIKQFGNIALVGKVLPSDLHTYVSRWTIGIIPFVESTLSEAVDPIKIYEYLYFGLPVVVTGISHLGQYPRTYFGTKFTIHEAISRAITDTTDIDALNEFLASTTWEARFDQLLKLITSRKLLSALYEN